MTQQQQVMAHLAFVGPLTQRDASKLYDVTRLGAIVYRLRRAGHDVIDLNSTVHGRAHREARYALRESV